MILRREILPLHDGVDRVAIRRAVLRDLRVFTPPQRGVQTRDGGNGQRPA